MITRYRVLQTRNPENGVWETSGAVFERTFGTPKVAVIPVAGAGDVKVNWREWDDIAKREREYGIFGPPLEEYDKVFADHADRYRLSEGIHTIEGDSYKEIRAKLINATSSTLCTNGKRQNTLSFLRSSGRKAPRAGEGDPRDERR